MLEQTFPLLTRSQSCSGRDFGGAAATHSCLSEADLLDAAGTYVVYHCVFRYSTARMVQRYPSDRQFFPHYSNLYLRHFQMPIERIDSFSKFSVSRRNTGPRVLCRPTAEAGVEK